MPQVRRPPPRGGHTAFIMNPKDSRIFIFGGANGDQFLQDFYSLNTQTLKWQSVHTYYPPRARAYHSAAIVAPEQRKLARGAVPVLLLYGGFNRGDCLSGERHGHPACTITLPHQHAWPRPVARPQRCGQAPLSTA